MYKFSFFLLSLVFLFSKSETCSNPTLLQYQSCDLEKSNPQTTKNQSPHSKEVLNSEKTNGEVLLLILKKLSSYEEEFKILNSKIDSIESKIGTMESKIGTMESKIGTMESKIGTMESEMQIGFEKLKEYLTGEKTIRISINSGVNLMSSHHNVTACGNLILHKNSLFVLTAKHAILENGKCVKQRLVFHQKSKKFIGVKQIYSHPIYDLALLLINEDDLSNYKQFTAEYSTSKLKFNQKLLGVCFRKKNPVFESAYVKEIPGNGSVLTNHGGSEGQSGCGYFDIYGKLAGVHLGSFMYKHEFTKEKKDKLKSQDLSDKSRMKKNFKKMSRNPRTRVGPAYLILEKELRELKIYKNCK
jgi:hypothetical protein